MNERHGTGAKRLGLPLGQHGTQRDVMASLFDALPAPALDDLARIARQRSLTPGELLADEGESLHEIGYVLNGTLGLTKVLADGRTHIVGLLVPTDMYGHLFDDRASFRIQALTQTTIVSFGREAFEAILRRHPDVERHFLLEILYELDAAREWIILMGARRAVERVAAFLLILCRRKLRRLRPATGQPVSITLTLRRADLAHYLGTRPETLSRALHALADRHIVRLNGPYHLEVLDLPRLGALSGEGLEADGGRT
jgi:CRP/FNR family transcriptional regulator